MNKRKTDAYFHIIDFTRGIIEELVGNTVEIRHSKKDLAKVPPKKRKNAQKYYNGTILPLDSEDALAFKISVEQNNGCVKTYKLSLFGLISVKDFGPKK